MRARRPISARSWPTTGHRLRLRSEGPNRVMTERVGLEVATLTMRIPMRLQRRGGRKLIITPEEAVPTSRPDETLVKALVRAHRWPRRIESGQANSITDLAGQEGVTDAYVCRLLPLTCLAPDIVEAILDGRQPKGLRLAQAHAESSTPSAGFLDGHAAALRRALAVSPGRCSPSRCACWQSSDRPAPAERCRWCRRPAR
jgi:hypothetical protein